MSKVMEQWFEEHFPEQDYYACFVGFETDLKNHSARLCSAYMDMDVYAQVELFAFVADLLEKNK